MIWVERIKKVTIAACGVVAALIGAPFRGNHPIILVGENKGRSAQDNGWIFYQWCRENQPDMQVFFLARRGNPDLGNLDDPNLVWFWTIRHIVLFFWASAFVYSHNLNDILRGGKLWQHLLRRKRHICLQHGMTGFKDVSEIRNAKVYRSDAFVVSGDLEAQLCIDAYGYTKTELVCTGLPRYQFLDSCSAKGAQIEIIYMPTWRSWATQEANRNIESTDYFKNIRRFLANPLLDEFLEKNDAVLSVYMHINMQAYCDSIHLNLKRIKIFKQGEIRVQNLIQRANVMVTDYSSVAWDFFYLKKPVVFYRFDLEEYQSKQGSLLDLNDELFGPVTSSANAVVQQLHTLADSEWCCEPRFLTEHGKIFRHHDQGQCSRVFGVVKSLLSESERNHPTIGSLKTPPPYTWKVH